MDIAPFAGLRYAVEDASPGDLTAPPYDVISSEEHARLLARSPYNVARLTLGTEPGEASDYEERGAILRRWITDGVLARDAAPGFYAYVIRYTVPGTRQTARFLGLIALGRLHELDERVVLPHEETFAKVVEDRYRVLAATRTHLETIFLLYADPEGAIDAVLERATGNAAVVEVEAKPGEVHALHAVSGADDMRDLVARFRAQRPIIADGHHRYTTSLRYRREGGADVAGADWQLMTFANLYSDGLSILATHRLVKLAGGALDAALETLGARLEPAGDDDWDLLVEWRAGRSAFRFPAALREGGSPRDRTSYALLHDVVLGEWLAGSLAGEGAVRYFKEGTGEAEALRSGAGDLLFRMRPVGREEFQRVVESGAVFPHKTTYFYPKLWSGLVLWEVADPAATR